jgi:hypothetical protein
VGRGSSAAAEAVSDALRRESHPFLDIRRHTAVLQIAAAASLAVVNNLYRFGVMRSVPEPPLTDLTPTESTRPEMRTSWSARPMRASASPAPACC